MDPVTEPGSFPEIRAVTSAPRGHRPGNKLWRRGAASLTCVELLAVVLDGGRDTDDAICRARRMLRGQGLRALSELDGAAWSREPGIGRATAARVSATFELARRASQEAPADRSKITRPQAAWAQVRSLGRARKEHLVGLYLDAQNGLLHRETISTGSLNTTRTHPREILYPAIEHLALGFVLAHNHPSGCLEPSPDDVEFTRAVRRAGELLGIELYDHLIVAGDRYVSLRERGVL